MTIVERKALAAQSCPTLCDPMDCPRQAPLSMGFSRQEYWRQLPCPSPGDLPKRGIEPRSPALWADYLPSEPQATREAQEYWRGLPCPFPGDLPDPGIEPWSPASQADSLTSEPPGKPQRGHCGCMGRESNLCLLPGRQEFYY